MRHHPQLLRSIPAIVGVALAGLVLIFNSGGGKAAEENVGRVVLGTPAPTISPPPAPFLHFFRTSFFQDESAPATVRLERGGYPYGGEVHVYLSTSDGTAVGGESCGPGIDYIRVVDALVSVGPKQPYADVNIPLCADGLSEPPETINLTITGGQAGEPHTAVLTISDEPIRYSISGRVRTAGGRGIWNAQLELCSPCDGGHSRYTYSRGSFGWYTFDNLPAGQSYTVYILGAPHHTFGHQGSHNTDQLVGDITDWDVTADP